MALEAGDLAPSAPIRRLGVLGGTFDPIHIGHLIVAEEARARLGLDRVLFVPANLSPLKAGSTFFSGEERYHMVRLAIEGNPHFAVSRVDLDRTGPSYTVDTLRAIQAEYGPSVQLYFIIGMDALETFAAWHRPEEIIRLTRLVVVSRPGHGADWAALEAEVPGIAAVTDVLPTLAIGISSTDIRQRILQGLPIRYQVPASVEAFILARQAVAEPSESAC